MLLKPWSWTPVCETCDAMNFTVFSRPSFNIAASPVASKCRKARPNWKPCVHSVQPRDVYRPLTVKTGVPFAGSHASHRAPAHRVREPPPAARNEYGAIMLILYDPRCADYGSSMRPEQPARVTKAAAHLRHSHPGWTWRVPGDRADDATLRLAHTDRHLQRLEQARDFDADTPFFPGIGQHARRSVAAALEAAEHACRQRAPAF